LNYGTANNATTGERQGEAGRLDSNYCEYELPPIPPRDVFDARWTIALTQGTTRNIFPRSNARDTNQAIYKARVQAGFITGDGSAAYPVTISWDRSLVPARNDATRNPSGASWHIRDGGTNGNYFAYDMALGEGRHSPTVIDFLRNGNICTIIINQDLVDGFNIVYDFVSGVEEEPLTGLTNGGFELGENQPNPFAGTTSFAFGVPTMSHVKIEVFDALGNVATVLADGQYNNGRYSLKWDGKNAQGIEMSSGMYLYRMTAGGFSQTRRMMLVR